MSTVTQEATKELQLHKHKKRVEEAALLLDRLVILHEEETKINWRLKELDDGADAVNFDDREPGDTIKIVLGRQFQSKR